MPNNQRTNPLLLIGLPVALVLLLAFAYYQVTVSEPKKQSAQMTQNFAMLLTGLAKPVTNSLDPRYTDANGDLIADAPTDATKVIDPQVIRFCYIATEDPERYQVAFQPLMSSLSKAIGRPIEYAVYTSPEEQLRAVRDGQLHITGLNTGAVPLAVNQAGFVPVAALANDTGSPFYETQILTPVASSIRSAADIKGRSLVLTDPSSNSGFKAPLVHLSKNLNLLPERDYLVRYSGGQDQSVEFIAAGKLDDSPDFAVAVASDFLTRAISRGTVSKDQFRVIDTLGKFPPATFGYAHNLKPELAAKIVEALASLKFTGATAEEFAPSGQVGLAPVQYKQDFELVRRSDDLTGNDHTKALVIPEPAAVIEPTAEPTTAPGN